MIDFNFHLFVHGQTVNQHTNKKISKVEYNNFLKEFTFDKIKGKSFGYAFCEKFEFNRSMLELLSDETAKFHIEKLGYIEK